ncbi:MAG: hypothetical protein RIR24_757 [Actinomycetota bacterium]|jgi:putative Holliday junction resolvase
MRHGRRFAIDVGAARVGLAVSDANSIVVTPLEHLRRDSKTLSLCLERINELGEVIEIFVGLPLNLKERETASTADAIQFARELQAVVGVDVRLVDERFSTRIASANLRTAGFSAIRQRGLIDSAAAAVILESAITHEKQTGTTAGVKVSDYASES